VLFDFDRVTDRKNTDSLKYDFASKLGKPEGLLSLWVADMDFPSPPCVLEALMEKTRHGIFGYSEAGRDYFEALQGWFSAHFGWNVHEDWLTETPGVIFAVNMAIRSLTDKGDAVLLQPPVYHPFYECIHENERKLATSQLVYSGGKYTVDFEDFEAQIVQNKVRLFILCSPHNPVGRVWTEDELLSMGRICQKHGVVVLSDEIHEDFVYPGHRHLVFADLKPGFSDITVTCTAPTKTFNLPGIQISNILIENADIRRRFRREMGKTGYKHPNIMGLTACRAAYLGGYEWIHALRAYLFESVELVRTFLSQNLPKIKLVEPEGTYLLWLDCKGLGLSDKELDEFITQRAGLWLNAGTMFGPGGSGFQRMNIACPRSVLKEALERLARAADSLERPQ